MRLPTQHLGFLPVAVLALAGVATAEVVPVGPETTINTTLTNEQRNCDISSNGSSPLVWVWESEQQDGSGRGIYGRVDRAPAEFQVHTYTTGDQAEPAIAHAPNDGFTVVWVSDSPNPGQSGILAQRFRPDGQKDGTEFAVRVSNGAKAEPAISYAPDGTFVVAWREDTGPWGIWARPYNGNGTPRAPAFQVLAVTGIPTGPALSHNFLGDVVICWGNAHAPPSPWVVEAICYDTGGNVVCQLTQANSNGFGAVDDVDISHAANGEFVITWASVGSGTTFRDIFARRFDVSGVPLGADFRVNTTLANNQLAPSIDHSAAGEFVIAWEGNGATWGRCFAADGTPSGGEFGFGFATGSPEIAFYEADEFGAGWPWIPTTVDEDIQGRSYRLDLSTGVAVASGAPGGLEVRAHPSVFRTRTTIAYELDSPSPVSVTVFDAAGRRIRSLARPLSAAGGHEVTWDGRDAAGAPVAAGVYFFAVRTGRESGTGRVVRLR